MKNAHKLYDQSGKCLGALKESNYAGYGKVYDDYGMVYEGQIKDKQYNGYGKEYCTAFVAEFKKDRFSIYEGEFKAGIPHGKGTMYVPNERHKKIYKGWHKCGRFNGQGTLYENNGNVVIGNFVDGKIIGKAQISKAIPNYIGGGNVKYEEYIGDVQCVKYRTSEGVVKDDIFRYKEEGLGKTIKSDGRIEKGLYHDGKLQK